jgi:hypothetical protein
MNSTAHPTHSRLTTILKYWLQVAFLTAFTCFVAYVVTQQVLRRLANDPQIQMAEYAALELECGRNPEELVKGDTIDISRSVAPFVILFNQDGAPIASDAVLDGVVPKPPGGVFHSCGQGKDYVTWQPRRGVRIASVIVHHGGAEPGFVLAGRSLRDSERRTDLIGVLLLAGWAFTAVASLFGIAAITYLTGPKVGA